MIEIDTGTREFHYYYLLPIKFKKKIQNTIIDIYKGK